MLQPFSVIAEVRKRPINIQAFWASQRYYLSDQFSLTIVWVMLFFFRISVEISVRFVKFSFSFIFSKIQISLIYSKKNPTPLNINWLLPYLTVDQHPFIFYPWWPWTCWRSYRTMLYTLTTYWPSDLFCCQLCLLSFYFLLSYFHSVFTSYHQFYLMNYEFQVFFHQTCYQKYYSIMKWRSHCQTNNWLLILSVN